MTSATDVCGACGKPISMKPDAVSRRKGKRPESYRCPKCARCAVRPVMGSTGGVYRNRKAS